MAITAKRHCIVDGKVAPYDNWYRLLDLSLDPPELELWVHETCIDRLVGIVANLTTRRELCDNLTREAAKGVTHWEPPTEPIMEGQTSEPPLPSCSTCNGTGRLDHDVCLECAGTGSMPRSVPI